MSTMHRRALGGSLGALLLGTTFGTGAMARASAAGGIVDAGAGAIKLKALHLFDGPDGQSRIETIDFEPIRQKILEDTALSGAGPLGFANLFESKAIEVNITAAPPGYFIDWHHAVRRHFFFTIQGIWETGLPDGSLHRVGPGQFLLAEDRLGRGHTSRVVSEDWAVAMDVVLGA